ncbi:TPA: hypothetical protein NJ597_001244 [Vibrio parahaemolyticus]|nr:hypothetical protein [Vibrio parahaemolyticus]
MIKKPVAGVGINDSDKPIQTTTYIDGVKVVTPCPYYKKWSLMLERCYKRGYESTVCDEWLTFSNFRDWCIEQEEEVGDISKLQLDKDLLSVSNSKVYSPETCCFLSKTVNSFLTTKKRSGSDNGLPVGVYRNKKRYQTGYSNPLTNERFYIGTYGTVKEAHDVWLSCKREMSNQLIEQGLVTQEHVKEALRSYY